jgi:hypothetical protein
MAKYAGVSDVTPFKTLTIRAQDGFIDPVQRLSRIKDWFHKTKLDKLICEMHAEFSQGSLLWFY